MKARPRTARVAFVDVAALAVFAIVGGALTGILAADHVHTWPAVAAACLLTIVLLGSSL